MTGSRLIALPLACALVYWPVVGYGFLAWDDDVYVTTHSLVLSSLTPRGVGQAFASFACSDWHPLTLISHLLDVSLFGAWAGGHHLINVLLHAVNAWLVFVLAWRLTSRWPESLVVAALFAVHPQRVESVAWISERKDVLCGTFFLLAILAYLRFAVATASRLRTVWYVAAVGGGVLACLAKPMAVTLPLVLLSIDVWLGRVLRESGSRILAEKTPLFVIAGLTAALTMLALARPRAGRPMPWLAFGWAWFLVMLVPVIGLVQVGSQATADRYYYLPGIGLEFGVVMTLGEALRRFMTGKESRRRPATVAAFSTRCRSFWPSPPCVPSGAHVAE